MHVFMYLMYVGATFVIKITHKFIHWFTFNSAVT